ncbi:MAG: hypothetical protein DMG13_22915 [Acidobacteria bacterium]|nr:MAG: hypothetical protein DMG13_22915 [Acidobacteriota bacterium]
MGSNSIVIVDVKDRPSLSGNPAFARIRGTDTLVQMLESISISVGRAKTAEDGVTLMDLLHPDLLLIDPSIPDALAAIDYAAVLGIDVIAMTQPEELPNHVKSYGVHWTLLEDDAWGSVVEVVLTFLGENRPAVPKNTGGRILVVDASGEDDERVAQFLAGRGFSVSTASIGSECMDLLVSDPSIEVVVLDSVLPDVCGMEILKSLSRWQSPPAVIMTSPLIDREVAQEARSLGALDYMIKPVNLQTLETNIVTCLVRSQYKPQPWWKRVAGGFVRAVPSS